MYVTSNPIHVLEDYLSSFISARSVSIKSLSRIARRGESSKQQSPMKKMCDYYMCSLDVRQEPYKRNGKES
jgi:hypothetical protein